VKSVAYKALTYLHLPVIEKDYKPGEMVEEDDLDAANQSEEDIENLVSNGSLGDEDADIHPSNIIPDPTMPNIEKVVADAQRVVADMEARGEDVPEDLRTVAEMEFKHVATGDEGKSGEKT
jgi:hypothetical protein